MSAASSEAAAGASADPGTLVADALAGHDVTRVRLRGDDVDSFRVRMSDAEMYEITPVENDLFRVAHYIKGGDIEVKEVDAPAVVMELRR